MIRGQVKRLTLDTTIPIERLLYPALSCRWTTSADFTLMAMFPLPFTGSYSHPSIGEVVNGELWLSTDTIKRSHVFPTYFCVIGPRRTSQDLSRRPSDTQPYFILEILESILLKRPFH